MTIKVTTLRAVLAGIASYQQPAGNTDFIKPEATADWVTAEASPHAAQPSLAINFVVAHSTLNYPFPRVTRTISGMLREVFAADTATLTEAVAILTGKASNDSVSLLSSTTLNTMKMAGDIAALQDSVVLTANIIRSLADTVTLTDSATFFGELPDIEASAAVLADYATLAANKGATESLTLTELVAFVAQTTIADTALLSEVINKHLGRPFTTQSLLLDESTNTAHLAAHDTPAILDSTRLSAAKPLADTSTLSESVSKATARMVTGDWATLSDSRTLTILKVVADNLPVTDSLTREWTAGRGFFDSFGLEDASAVAAGVDQNKTNLVFVEDVAYFVVTRPIYDSVNAADSLQVFVSKQLSDTIGFTDGISFGDEATAFSDPATLTDLTDVQLSLDATALLNARPLNHSSFNA